MRTQTAAAAAVVLLALTACTGPTAASPDAPSTAGGAGGAETRLAAVREAGMLRVCTTGDYRPFTYLDPETEEYRGIDITMVEDLAETLGVEVEYVKTTWPTLMEDFLAGCDIGVGGISISMERAARAYYTDPTLTEGKTPITRCENVEKYDTIAEINRPGVRSIMPPGGTNEEFAEEHYPKGELIRFEDNNRIFDEIIEGRADVMTTDASETRWVAHEKPELCAVHPDDPFNFSQKAYLLPQGDDVFREYVNEWLNMARHDGTYDAAKEPWFG